MTSDNPTLASTCPARHTCRLVGVPERCHVGCAWHIEQTYQLALSGIDEENRMYTVETLPDTWENIDTLRRFSTAASERRPNNGLFLTSPLTGNGKTMSACAVAMSFILARTKRALAKNESCGQLVAFVNVVDLLDAIKAGYNDDVARVEADRLLARIAKAEMVVLDDLGTTKPTSWSEERFYSMFNAIWAARHRQTIVVTSNLTLDQIGITLGERIRSRLDGLTVAVPFQGDDRRRKKYEEGTK